ncbi:MAG: dihydropteroate synthase [Phycisphaerae bacterium]|nr:MAG: dihydropteroate synthase [Phycisphaerae bacterium]
MLDGRHSYNIIKSMTNSAKNPNADPPSNIQIMGILNVTPDSFSDGGKFAAVDRAVEHALQMIDDGADIIDVGPESTRPGSQLVPDQEQTRRGIPAIKAIRANNSSVAISIDTQSAQVAEAALDAGADIVNDISALRNDPKMASLVAGRKCRVVLMHMQGTPKTMQNNPTYNDVVKEGIAFLQERCDVAAHAGIDSNDIIVDPGIGFGKSTAHNLTIMRRLGEYQSLGVPVLLGVSRKRFLDEITPGKTQPDQRLAASLACVAQAIQTGVQFLRVHDVAETRQFVTATQAINTQN